MMMARGTRRSVGEGEELTPGGGARGNHFVARRLGGAHGNRSLWLLLSSVSVNEKRRYARLHDWFVRALQVCLRRCGALQGGVGRCSDGERRLRKHPGLA